MLVILVGGFYGVVYLCFTHGLQFRDLISRKSELEEKIAAIIQFYDVFFFYIGMMRIPLGGMFIAVHREFYRAPFITVCGTRLLLLIEDEDETTRFAGSALALLAHRFRQKEVQCKQSSDHGDRNTFGIVLRNGTLYLLQHR